MKDELSQEMKELLQRVAEWRNLIYSHPNRRKADQFLSSYIESDAIETPRSEWVDSLELPEDLIGGFQIGSLSKIPLLT